MCTPPIWLLWNKLSLKDVKFYLQFSISHLENNKHMEESAPVRPKLKFWTLMQNATCDGNVTLHITLSTPPLAWNMVLTASGYEDALLQRRQGSCSKLMSKLLQRNTVQSQKKTCYSLQRSWGGDSSFIRTTVLNVQLKIQWNRLRQSMLMY